MKGIGKRTHKDRTVSYRARVRIKGHPVLIQSFTSKTLAMKWKRKIINDYRDRVAAHVDLKNPAYQPEWNEVDSIGQLFLKCLRTFGVLLGEESNFSKRLIRKISQLRGYVPDSIEILEHL